jgi:hypothetical protein
MTFYLWLPFAMLGHGCNQCVGIRIQLDGRITRNVPIYARYKTIIVIIGTMSL